MALPRAFDQSAHAMTTTVAINIYRLPLHSTTPLPPLIARRIATPWRCRNEQAVAVATPAQHRRRPPHSTGSRSSQLHLPRPRPHQASSLRCRGGRVAAGAHIARDCRTMSPRVDRSMRHARYAHGTKCKTDTLGENWAYVAEQVLWCASGGRGDFR